MKESLILLSLLLASNLCQAKKFYEMQMQYCPGGDSCEMGNNENYLEFLDGDTNSCAKAAVMLLREFGRGEITKSYQKAFGDGPTYIKVELHATVDGKVDAQSSYFSYSYKPEPDESGEEQKYRTEKISFGQEDCQDSASELHSKFLDIVAYRECMKLGRGKFKEKDEFIIELCREEYPNFMELRPSIKKSGHGEIESSREAQESKSTYTYQKGRSRQIKMPDKYKGSTSPMLDSHKL